MHRLEIAAWIIFAGPWIAILVLVYINSRERLRSKTLSYELHRQRLNNAHLRSTYCVSELFLNHAKVLSMLNENDMSGIPEENWVDADVAEFWPEGSIVLHRHFRGENIADAYALSTYWRPSKAEELRRNKVAFLLVLRASPYGHGSSNN